MQIGKTELVIALVEVAVRYWCVFYLIKDVLSFQVYPQGIRHIRADKRVNEWRAPGKKIITRCALNERQVVISLSGGEIVYFEMDQVMSKHWSVSHQFPWYCYLEWSIERVYWTERDGCRDCVYELRHSASWWTEIEISGRRISRWDCPYYISRSIGKLLVKDLGFYVFIHFLQDTLQPLSMQALPAAPESLCIVEMGGSGDRAFTVGGLFLNIGLQNGVLLRTALDSVTGDLSDTRTR